MKIATEDYTKNYANYKEMADITGSDCIPADINGAFVPLDKLNKTNLQKTQRNIGERFGMPFDK